MSPQQARKLASQALQKGKLQYAKQLCLQILKRIPNDANTLYLLGGIAYHGKHYDEALEFLLQVVKYSPKFLDAYLKVALIYKDLGKYQEAIIWYKKGFSLAFKSNNNFNIETVIVLMTQVPPIDWRPYAEHFIHYGECLYQVEQLQKITVRLPQLIKHINWKLAEKDLQATILGLLQVLRFDKSTDRNWNTSVFQHVGLPCMQQALAHDFYALGLILESSIYHNHIKPKETAEHFSTCFSLWVGDMCDAGQRVKATLPPLDKSVLHHAVPTIGFFIHKASLLAHIEIVLNMLEGVSQLDEELFKPIIYAFDGYDEEMLVRCQKIGVPVVFLSKQCNQESRYEKLLFLREQTAQDQVAALVWVSLATMMPFAFSMRIAPVQIWWAMKYHGLEFDDIDGYLTGASSGASKKIGNKVWRTSSLGISGWYDPMLKQEAQTIRAQYHKKFDIILGSMGREEKLNSSEFLETIAKILKKYPKAAFLWTGREQLPSIQAVFDQYEVSNQCFFIGWVNTKLYAQVLDIFLDSFPFPCGFTAYETIAASNPIVLYASNDSYNTGLYGAISPVLMGKMGSPDEHQLINEIFHPQEKSVYFCANNAEQYFDYTCQLIENENLRQQSGYAYSQFIEHFFTNTQKMAQGYARHFLEMILECRH
ncbi:hypothetical protein [Candidatus Albibeggiatoa sp. nov. NOAA]|uniref:hypothetical protein n=1 Tax=Candidatus Albibeggiatoa sp. nov. NOAA TaxID=3162724 RepID=UPI00330467DD|nr:hypothetical protein [Thiotrichaceae bacterium]